MRASFNHAYGFVFVNGLHFSKVHHLLHGLLNRPVSTENAARIESFTHGGIGLRGIVCDLLGRMLLSWHLAVAAHDLQEFVTFHTEKKVIFRGVFSEGLQIVTYLHFHLCLFSHRQLQEPDAHSLQPDAAQQEVIGDLARQSPEARLNFQKPLKKHLFSAGHAKTVQDVCRHVLVVTCKTAKDAEDELRDAVCSIHCVICEGQYQFLIVPQVFNRIGVQFETKNEYMQCMFKGEDGALDDDAPHAMFEHLPRAKAHFSEGVDGPWPILTISHLPLRLPQLLLAQKSVDHQVSHQYYRWREIRIHQLQNNFQILDGQLLGWRFSQFPNNCRFIFLEGVSACLLHDVGELLFANVAAEVVESILNFHRYYRRIFKWQQEAIILLILFISLSPHANAPAQNPNRPPHLLDVLGATETRSNDYFY